MGFIADIFGGGGKAETPPTPEPPRAAPAPSATAAEAERKRRRGLLRSGTVLTSPGGVLGAAPGEKKTLLGG